MSLTDKINDDIKAAMLAKEKDKLEALRAVKAALLLAKTQGGAGGDVTEDDEIKLLQKLVKQRKEAAEIYLGQDRNDLAEPELFQAAIIEKFLPQQMPVEEVKAIISSVIDETGATSVKELGKVMGIVSKKLAGKADNKMVSEIIRSLLPS